MTTIPAIVLKNGKIHPDKEAYFVKKNGLWVGSTWDQYAGLVRRAAKSLLAHGLRQGEATAILGANRPEWVIFDVATMAIGAVPAGIYATSSPVEVTYILNHCEAKVLIVENKDQWEKVKKEWDAEQLQHLQKVVIIEGESDDARLVEWETFLAAGDGKEDEKVDEAVAGLQESSLATLIYTSGTTGPPKGVMLTHKNLSWTSNEAAELCRLTSEDVNLSFLPLSHIAEQMFTIHIPAMKASRVFYCEGMPKMLDNLKEVKPTIFFGVPRVWEKFFTAVNAQLPPELKGDVSLLPELHKAGIRAAIGLERCRLAVSGAAPISKPLGITIREVYGMSEVTGPTSFNTEERTKLGTVGPVFPGVEVKIVEDGEIVVKGPNVFSGYYKNQAATDEALKDGWLYSGDLGGFDDEGYMLITGRKKDIIITSGGKNITPINIENAVKTHPLIGECVVVGDARHFLTALISIDLDIATKVAEGKGIPLDLLLKAPATLESIQTHVDEVNKNLAQVETIKKFKILPRPLDIPNGELTPTMKVKRAVVYRNWLPEIEAMYA